MTCAALAVAIAFLQRHTRKQYSARNPGLVRSSNFIASHKRAQDASGAGLLEESIISPQKYDQKRAGARDLQFSITENGRAAATLAALALFFASRCLGGATHKTREDLHTKIRFVQAPNLPLPGAYPQQPDALGSTPLDLVTTRVVNVSALVG